jgi:hypothetical protein
MILLLVRRVAAVIAPIVPSALLGVITTRETAAPFVDASDSAAAGLIARNSAEPFVLSEDRARPLCSPPISPHRPSSLPTP